MLLVRVAELRKARGWFGPGKGGTHVALAPHEDERAGGGGGRSPSDLVQSPNGGIDFGVIDDSVGAAMKRQAGAIRLPYGEHRSDGGGYGLVHIEASHGQHIRGAGFASVEEFVAHVAAHFEQVWQASGRQLLVAVRDGRQHMMYVQLEPAANGDYYRVNTAFPVRQDDYPEKHGFKPLWDGREPTSSASGKQTAFAASTEQSSGQVGPNARGQSGRTIIPKPLEKSSGCPAVLFLSRQRRP